MKIAMIGHKRVPSREGGVEIVVEELSTRLVEQGYQVDIYNRKGKNVQDKNADKEKRKLKEYKGAKIITIPTINKKGIDALLYSFFATIKAVFKKYDCLHYHAEGSCAMLWIPHIFRKRIIVTIHGLDWQRSKWGGFATKYIKFGEKMAAKYADEIIVLSKGVQKYFKNTYNRDTHFVPNGVNKPIIKNAEIIKEKYGLEKDKYILFLARIVPEKGLHYLIDAFKDIKTDKRLVIAGGASHTNDYLKKIKEKAKQDDRIIMTGFVQGQELEELYSNCYLYCLPSDVEGMPISLLEAMSYGCNCLVSDIEENTQVCGNLATTFEKGNVSDLKDKLELLIYNFNKDINCATISDYVLQKYSWENVVKQIEKLYTRQGDGEMKTKYITCISYHGTGSGAVDDFFREFDNFASAQSEVECRYLQDPDGISDLEYNLIENPHRLNSGFALKRYLIFAKEMGYTYRKIFGKKWIEYSKEYIDSLAKFSYKGYWHGDLRIISKPKLGIYYARRAWSKIVPKKYKKATWYNYFPNMNSYHSFISQDDFLEKTKKYTSKLCEALNTKNKEFLMLDQFVPTMNIKRYLRYMDNLKVIIVDRDPRDTYLNMIKLGDHVLPKDPHQFCVVYKDIRRTLEEEMKEENVIYVKFEDLIYNYEKTTKQLMDFVGIKEENHVRPKEIFKPEVSKNNTQQWKKYPQLENEMKIIEEELSEYLYKFDN